MSDERPFSRRALVWLVSISVASFATWLVVGLVAPEPADVESADADAYSRSAIGHRAFVELMRAQERAGDGQPLRLRQPRGRPGAAGAWPSHVWTSDSPARSRKLQQMLRVGAAHRCWCCPNGRGTRTASIAAGWIARSWSPPTAIARACCRTRTCPRVRAASGRRRRCSPARARSPCRRCERPQLLRPTEATSRSPRSSPARTAGCSRSARTRRAARLLILSDPDVLANHGLGDGDNAAVAWSVLGYARQPGQAVVLDETLHGHERVPSLWRELFTFPLAARDRAGGAGDRVPGVGRAAPLRRSGAAAARLAAGKGVLVENTAALLRLGGHSAYTLGRYLESLTYGGRARAPRDPPELAPAEMRARLRADRPPAARHRGSGRARDVGRTAAARRRAGAGVRCWPSRGACTAGDRRCSVDLNALAAVYGPGCVGGDPPGGRRPGPGHRPPAGGAAVRGPRAARGRAGHRQDAARAVLRGRPVAALQAHPVHARPDAGRRARHEPLRLRAQPVRAEPRARLHEHPARRRDQPHAAQDAGRAARGDAGARGHDRRRRPTRWATRSS